MGGVSVAVSQTARLARTLTSIPDSLLDRRGRRRRRSHSLHPCSLTVPDSRSLSLSLSLAPRHVANLSVRRRSRGTPRQSAVRTDRALSTSRHGCVLPRAPRVLFFTKLLFIANNRTWSDLVDAPHSCIDINCRLLSQTGAVQLRTARDTADAASMSVRLLQRNGNYVRRSCSQEMISLTEY